MKKVELPDLHFGKYSEEAIDWRKRLVNEPAEEDDDENRPAEPWVVQMLGFDPDELFPEDDVVEERVKKGGPGSGNH
jgi:hypothetical protein